MPEPLHIRRGGRGNQKNPLTPLELMGLAGLLRAWRAAAGEKRGLGRPITQREVADGIGRSVRWYIELEKGAVPRLERAVLDALTRELMLGPDEELTLHLYALGGGLSTIPNQSADERTRSLLQLMLDQFMPNPAYISDISWDIIGFNAAMAEWYPWVRERGANLMRWALRSPEARRQFVNWEHHAAVYLAQLRFAIAQHQRNPALEQLLTYVLQDPGCERLWNAGATVKKSGDGRHFRMALPRFDYEIIHVVSHVLYPASLPESRLVLITWLKEESMPILPTPRDTAHESAATASGLRNLRTSSALHPYRSVDSAKQAADMAGDNAVPLPVLSRLAGPRCQLTLSPEFRTVIWATEQDDGRWAYEELDPYTVIKQLPPGGIPRQASDEYKQLLRALLPSDPRQASRRIDTLLLDYVTRAQHLAEIRQELSDQHPGDVPPAKGLSETLAGPNVSRMLRTADTATDTPPK